MKKFALVLVVILAVFVLARGYFADKPVLRIGMECDYVPNNWEEKRPTDSNLPLVNHEGFYAEGYDLQVAKFIAEKLGYKLEVKKIAWEKLLDALNKNEIDAIFSGMLDTLERKEVAAFSDTYEIDQTIYGICVNTDTKYKDAKTLNDFSGAKFTGQKGTRLYTAIEQIPGAVQLEAVDTVSEMLDMLKSGQVDAIVINLDTGLSYERRFRNVKLVELPEGGGFNFDFRGICAGVRKKDTKLLSDINGVLGKMSRKERQQLMDKAVVQLWRNN